MAKFRVRTKGKGKRWKKGQSSSSNPSVTKHRDKARSNFFQENLDGPNLLTAEALQKHDAFVGSNESKPMEEDVDAISVGASTYKTTDTFATDFSGCTNMSYSKLLSQFDPSSAIQKEKLAVLAAISEVIKSNGGTENNTEYFAALMTVLENGECEEMSVAAVLSLLAMGIKHVPQPVLQQRFSQCSKIFVDILAKHADSQNNIIYRGALGCLSVFLRNQPSHVWKDSSTVQIFHTILMFTVHSKPKVRKAAQHAVCSLLRTSSIAMSEDGKSLHPAAPITAEFCVHQIEKNGTLNSSTTTTLHILGLLKEVMFTFPKKHMKAACETILKVMTLGNVVVLSCGMQALHGLFISRPPPKSLPSDLNAQLITALYDYQPQSTDTQPMQAWLAVMQEAIINLSKSNLTLSITNLPKLLETAVSLWLTGKTETMNAATLTVKACLEDCVTPAAEPAVVGNYELQISKIINLFRSTLGYKYHAVWSHALHLCGVLFKACGKTCSQMLLPCLKELAELRDSAIFSFMDELDYCVGDAVRSMGPEFIVKAIPLQLLEGDRKHEFKRSWLLPVLRQNIKTSTLQCFIDHFLPLAVHCRNRSDEMKNINNQIRALSYDLLQTQIWALLPSFCHHATDIASSFSKIAKVLGSVLGSRKELRISVMAALRKLILCAKETEPESGDSKEVARFAKNFLPILFNIYTTPTTGTEEGGIRVAAFETIKVYLSLASESLCLELFEKAMAKFSVENVDKFVKESVLDLLRLLLPFQSAETICGLYDKTIANIKDIKNHIEEKKYYRLLDVICSSESDGCVLFLNQKMSQVRELLLKSLSSNVPTSKGPRLLCLLHLLDRQQEGELEDFIAQVMPEGVLCCQDINSRCRTLAYEIITKMAEKMSERGQFENYIELVSAGLAGSSRVASATILALASLTYHCREKMTDDTVTQLLNNVLLLSCSSTREIVRAALSFIKLYITTFDRSTIARQLPFLMKAIVNMADDCKRHFRLKTRDILARFVRWYGAENILSMIPATDTTMRTRVRNLRKIDDRKKKLRQQASETKSSVSDEVEFSVKKKPKTIDEILAESDSDLDLDEPQAQKSKKSKSEAWIQEDVDDFVDFTAKAANKKITSTKPERKTVGLMTTENRNKEKDKNRGFKTAPDGRLIITKDVYDDDDDGGGRNKTKFSVPGLDSDDNDYDDVDDDDDVDMDKKSRKRKMSVSSDATAMKYKAGGSGIHRPITKAKTKNMNNSGNKSVNNFGSEYRSRKAKGDMKKKGLPDPYAYVPLQRNILNKRKSKKASGLFNKVVNKKAKKGAPKGGNKR